MAERSLGGGQGSERSARTPGTRGLRAIETAVLRVRESQGRPLASTKLSESPEDRSGSLSPIGPGSDEDAAGHTVPRLLDVNRCTRPSGRDRHRGAGSRADESARARNPHRQDPLQHASRHRSTQPEARPLGRAVRPALRQAQFRRPRFNPCRRRLPPRRPRCPQLSVSRAGTRSSPRWIRQLDNPDSKSWSWEPTFSARAGRLPPRSTDRRRRPVVRRKARAP